MTVYGFRDLGSKGNDRFGESFYKAPITVTTHLKMS